MDELIKIPTEGVIYAGNLLARRPGVSFRTVVKVNCESR